MNKKAIKFNKQKYRPKKNKKIFFIFTTLLFLGIIYLLFFSPVFNIKEIIVLGNKKVSSEEIKNNLIRDNIFLTNNKSIEDQLLKKIPEILELKINKNLLKRKLEINIKERETVGIICSIGTCFYFDENGIIFDDAPNTSGSLIVVIQDNSGRNYEIGNKISEKTFIDTVLEINENLFSEIGLRVSSFNIDSYPIEELKAVTTEGWYALFNLKKDTENQLLALKVALNEKIKDRTGLQYIDLRIENRIYYK